jgi:HAD superfamily hydrolase (TIGR01459 family)
MPIPVIAGLAEISAHYDAFILDLWGVLHDGGTPYPEAIACLLALRNAGKKVALLSNSPRRVTFSEDALAAIGFDRDLYDFIITSGELTHEALLKRDDSWLQKLGKQCLLIAEDEEELSTFDGLGLERVASPKDASFILNIGPSGLDNDMERWEHLLMACRAAALPMVCANPDVTCFHLGSLATCAGALASRYEALGGAVRYYGKPYPEGYRAVLARLGTAPARALMIGDNLDTDIRGAIGAGLDGLLITSGIHLPALGGAWGEKPSKEQLRVLLDEAEVKPKWGCASLKWE